MTHFLHFIQVFSTNILHNSRVIQGNTLYCYPLRIFLKKNNDFLATAVKELRLKKTRLWKSKATNSVT